MTGYHTPETEARILDCGAIRCFAKPVDPATIIQCIEAQLKKGPRSTRRGRSARG